MIVFLYLVGLAMGAIGTLGLAASAGFPAACLFIGGCIFFVGGCVVYAIGEASKSKK